MKGRSLKIAPLALGLLIAATGTAYGLPIVAGNIVISADGGFSPTALPKSVDAPITLHGGGSLSTVDGSLPPILKTLTIDFDKHGSLQTVGLAVCTKGKLTNTTVAEARHNCPGAIVGEGFGRAIVQFPDAKPIPATSPITIFNGPRVHGQDTVFAHAYTTIPVPTTFIVPVVIQKIHEGRYGYRTTATIPPIAGGYGVPIAGHLKIGRKWTYKGVHHSYVNARCPDGHLQARGSFTFSDGRTQLHHHPQLQGAEVERRCDQASSRAGGVSRHKTASAPQRWLPWLSQPTAPNGPPAGSQAEGRTQQHSKQPIGCTSSFAPSFVVA